MMVRFFPGLNFYWFGILFGFGVVFVIFSISIVPLNSMRERIICIFFGLDWWIGIRYHFCLVCCVVKNCNVVLMDV